ncbi:MAG: membrane-associated phospholipid phosphatase, partial [Granulosicoccus sp.]
MHGRNQIGQPALIFLLFSIFWSIALGLAELWIGRNELHLTLNQLHWPIADSFFQYLTHLGSGLVPTIVAVALLFSNLRWALTIGIANAFTSIIVQSAKHGLFSHMKRPTALLSDQLYLPPNIDFHAHNSFPSGHSATAFCLGMCLLFMTTNRKLAIPVFFLFALTAYSRVYLSQHFTGDVAVGSIIGTGCALVGFFAVNRLKYDRLEKG